MKSVLLKFLFAFIQKILYALLRSEFDDDENSNDREILSSLGNEGKEEFLSMQNDPPYLFIKNMQCEGQ